MSAWVPAVLGDGWNILKMGSQASKMSLVEGVLKLPSRNAASRVDELITGDRHVTVNDIAAKLAVEHSTVQKMIQRFSKGLCLLGPKFIDQRPQTSEKNHLGGKLFHILLTVPTWHPPTTIFSVLLRNRCETNTTRRWRILGKQCINVYGQLEWVLSQEHFQTCRTMGKMCANNGDYVERWQKSL